MREIWKESLKNIFNVVDIIIKQVWLFIFICIVKITFTLCVHNITKTWEKLFNHLNVDDNFTVLNTKLAVVFR